jgi:hypothetical protein
MVPEALEFGAFAPAEVPADIGVIGRLQIMNNHFIFAQDFFIDFGGDKLAEISEGESLKKAQGLKIPDDIKISRGDPNDMLFFIIKILGEDVKLQESVGGEIGKLFPDQGWVRKLESHFPGFDNQLLTETGQGVNQESVHQLAGKDKIAISPDFIKRDPADDVFHGEGGGGEIENRGHQFAILVPELVIFGAMVVQQVFHQFGGIAETGKEPFGVGEFGFLLRNKKLADVQQFVGKRIQEFNEFCARDSF